MANPNNAASSERLFNTLKKSSKRPRPSIPNKHAEVEKAHLRQNRPTKDLRSNNNTNLNQDYQMAKHLLDELKQRNYVDANNNMGS